MVVHVSGVATALEGKERIQQSRQNHRRGAGSELCGDDSAGRTDRPGAAGRAVGDKSVLASVANEQPTPEPRGTSERARRRRPARSKVRDRAGRP
jgi:hypothetical protein